jgi:hypothetical protein
MTELEQKRAEFAEKWHQQIVKRKGEHELTKPDSEYLVTAALWKYENNDRTTILGIQSVDASEKLWLAIHIEDEEFEKVMGDFEVVRSGRELYLKRGFDKAVLDDSKVWS